MTSDQQNGTLSTSSLGTISGLVDDHDLIYQNHLEKFNNSGSIIPENTQINIEQSSDVIIGPVTQFTGPVTIYQHLNGQKPETNDENVQFKSVKSVKEDKPVQENHENKSQNSQMKKKTSIKKVWIVSMALCICLVLIAIAITTSLTLEPKKDHPTTNKPPKPDIVFPSIPPSKPSSQFLGHHSLISRSEWGGREPKFVQKLTPPVKLVIISHTVSKMCNSIQECSMKMQSFQAQHVSNGSPDIGYNFLIGHDSNIYIGRGWDVRNFHQNNSIGICFIGNYVFDELTNEMIEAAQLLLEDGVKMKKLDENYVLVAHNQTYATESPGVNVYKVIKNWPHFSNASYFT